MAKIDVHDVIANEVQIQTNVAAEFDVEGQACVVVQRSKSNLKETGSRRKFGERKKRVRFLDSEVERVSVWRRFGQFFIFLLRCTRSTVETVLRKSVAIL